MPSQKRERQRQNRGSKVAQAQAARRRAQRRRKGITYGIGAAAILAVIILLIIQSSSGGSKKVASSTSTTSKAGATTTPASTPATSVVPAAAVTPGTTPCPAADGSSPRTTTFDGPPKMCIDAAKTYKATIETDAGTISIDFDPKQAPQTVNNFVFLARYHYFDGLTFHRVIPKFVLQGGDPAGTGSGGPGYKFNDELPKAGQYKVGSLAMANSGPNTNGSQFFIIAGADGAALPPSYSLFGQVTGGIDIVHKIEADGAADPNPPKVVHKMTKVTITEA